jgi:hypothetical protein
LGGSDISEEQLGLADRVTSEQKEVRGYALGRDRRDKPSPWEGKSGGHREVMSGVKVKA